MAPIHIWIVAGLAVFAAGILAVWSTLEFLARGDYAAAMLGLATAVVCFRAGSSAQARSLRTLHWSKTRPDEEPSARVGGSE